MTTHHDPIRDLVLLDFRTAFAEDGEQALSDLRVLVTDRALCQQRMACLRVAHRSQAANGLPGRLFELTAAELNSDSAKVEELHRFTCDPDALWHAHLTINEETATPGAEGEKPAPAQNPAPVPNQRPSLSTWGKLLAASIAVLLIGTVCGAAFLANQLAEAQRSVEQLRAAGFIKPVFWNGWSDRVRQPSPFLIATENELFISGVAGAAIESIQVAWDDAPNAPAQTIYQRDPKAAGTRIPFLGRKEYKLDGRVVHPRVTVVPIPGAEDTLSELGFDEGKRAAVGAFRCSPLGLVVHSQRADPAYEFAAFILRKHGWIQVHNSPKEARELGDLPARPWLQKVGSDHRTFTDADVAQLVPVAGSLQGLHIAATGITNAALPDIGSIKTLYWLYLGNTAINDAGLVHLKGLTNLTVLDLGNNTNISDKGIVHLRTLANLSWLRLQATAVTDASVTTLEQLKNLRNLNLRYTNVTAAGVARLEKSLPNCKIDWGARGGEGLGTPELARQIIEHGGRFRIEGGGDITALKDLPTGKFDIAQVYIEGNRNFKNADLRLLREGIPALKTLSVSSTGITNEGLAEIAHLRSLLYLYLADCRIGDDGVKQLAGLRNLQNLSLNETDITDAGLAALKDVQALTYLNLRGTRIGDASLPHLMGLKNLEIIVLRNTDVSAAGVARLKAALPNCKVER